MYDFFDFVNNFEHVELEKNDVDNNVRRRYLYYANDPFELYSKNNFLSVIVYQKE